MPVKSVGGNQNIISLVNSDKYSKVCKN